MLPHLPPQDNPDGLFRILAPTFGPTDENMVRALERQVRHM
jgi:hypothetical protein